MSILVRQPGILSLLQDGGRFGYHHLGLTRGGAMDPFALVWANLLCDNAPTECAIEVSIGGLEIEFDCTTRVAVTGAQVDLQLNGAAVDTWRTLCVRCGDTLRLGYARRGVRSYLAISGGFQVDPWMGSRSTVVREGVGGIDGGALRSGHRLACSTDTNPDCWRVPLDSRPVYGNQATLRLIPGFQNRLFERRQQQVFFQSEFRVGKLSNSMGYRLEGPGIHADLQGILSEGICMGAVQIPPDGKPIVLMNDHQTIGGYPKIGTVLSLDLAKLAQLRQGDRVHFAAITQESAVTALKYARQHLQTIRLEAVEDD